MTIKKQTAKISKKKGPGNTYSCVKNYFELQVPIVTPPPHVYLQSNEEMDVESSEPSGENGWVLYLGNKVWKKTKRKPFPLL